MRRSGGVVVAVLLLVALLAAPGGTDETATTTYRVSPVKTREQRSAVAATGAGIDSVERDYVVVRALAEERDAIRAKGFTVEELITAADFPPSDSDYHNFAEMQAELDALASAHPTTVRRFTIGTSYEGRPLEAVRISDDATDNLSEPGVFFIGLHHAREHMTVEVALDLVRLFAESTDPAIANLVTSRQIYIVPNMNPDGGEYDIATGSYREWRKNRQPNGAGSPVGTDPNRNYGYRWGCCGGSSGNKGSETYRGPSAFSAPETAAVRDFINAHPNVATGISYHAYGGLVLYPYGYTYTDVPSDMTKLDHDSFVAMAKQIASTTGYKAEQSSDLYITDGDLLDWMYGAKGMFPFTIELSGNTFYPDDSKIPAEVARNRDAAVYVASMADCPRRAGGDACGSGPPPGGGGTILNGDFEAGLTGWTARKATAASAPTHGGTGSARLAGGNGASDRLTQKFTVPAGGQLSLYALVTGSDTTSKDKLTIKITDASGVRETVALLNSSAPHDTWQLLQADLSAYAGQTVELRIQADTNATAPSTFFVDDCTV